MEILEIRCAGGTRTRDLHCHAALPLSFRTPKQNMVYHHPCSHGYIIFTPFLRKKDARVSRHRHPDSKHSIKMLQLRNHEYKMQFLTSTALHGLPPPDTHRMKIVTQLNGMSPELLQYLCNGNAILHARTTHYP